MYRGLPCIYSSAILSSASLLSGGSMALLRVLALAMIIFMIRQTFYPHDRVLESQAWKKVVYAGGKKTSLFPQHVAFAEGQTSPNVLFRLLFVITLGIVFCCHQESSWCSFSLPSPPPVSTTCCGPSPTCCSQLPSGAVKYKSAPELPQTQAAPGRAEASCGGGLELSALVQGRPALQLPVALYLLPTIKVLKRQKRTDTVPVFGLVHTLKTE